MNAMLAGFRHCRTRVGEVGIHAVIGGEGPPLVLIHGFPQTWWAWHKIMPKLAVHHTVVAVDLRGAGHSDTPLTGFDKATLAGDVHATMEALGFTRYAVCGHDIGAMVALALAFTQRDAVTRVAVMDTAMPGWSRWESMFADPRLWHYAFHMKRDLPERLLAGREHDYVATFIFERAYNLGGHAAGDIDMVARALAQPGNTRGGLEWYRAFPADHVNATAWKRDKLAMPVLALGGEHRFGPGMVSMLEEFALNVTGGSIAGCAHWLVEESPDQTTDVLESFLAS